MSRGIGHGYLLGFLLSAGLLIMPSRPSKPSSDPQSPPSHTQESFQSLDDILQYISDDWGNLKRSLTDCKTFEDAKTEGEPILYLPRSEERRVGKGGCALRA